MEIGKRLDPRYVFFGLYIFAFIIYIIIGLQPAEAVDLQISSRLSIPKIRLDSDVTSLKMEDHELKTPDTIVGSYDSAINKTLLIGHSSTVFNRLNEVSIGDEILYGEKTYIIKTRETIKKEDILMTKLLSESEVDTLVIMTCAGDNLGMGDATHRLIITATNV